MRSPDLLVKTLKTKKKSILDNSVERFSSKKCFQNSMNTLGKQLSAYSFLVISLIMVIGLIQGKKMLSMFNIGVSCLQNFSLLYVRVYGGRGGGNGVIECLE